MATNGEKGIETARKIIEEVYGKGRTELIDQLYADEYREHDPLTGTFDRSGVERDVQTYRRAFPDLEMKVIDAFASGDRVTMRIRSSGTHKGELMGIPPTNRRSTIEGTIVGRMKDGKMAEAWVQYDVMGMFRQLGLLPEAIASAMKQPDGGKRAGATGAQRR